MADSTTRCIGIRDSTIAQPKTPEPCFLDLEPTASILQQPRRQAQQAKCSVDVRPPRVPRHWPPAANPLTVAPPQQSQEEIRALEAEANFTVQQAVATVVLLYLCMSPDLSAYLACRLLARQLPSLSTLPARSSRCFHLTCTTHHPVTSDDGTTPSRSGGCMK